MRIIFLVIPYFFSTLFLNRNRSMDTARLNELPLDAKNSIYQYTVKNIDGEMVSLSKYKGKVLVIINVASECGNTPQYERIENFYKNYFNQNVVVLGFPANNFGGQEPGSDKVIKAFCSSKYSVTFPMFSKISVKGDDMAPLYKFLTSKDLNGVEDSEVRWNFQKYVINKDGYLVGHFSPRMEVTDEGFMATIKKLL
jgi:glutathione peroxidase